MTFRPVATAIAIGALLLTPVGAAAHSLEELNRTLFDREKYFQIMDAATPDFVLQDSSGKPVRLADLRGKVVVLRFVYASCPDECPLHAEKLAEVQKMVNITPMKGEVEFITITTDPSRDTPEVMRRYGADHGLDPANWLFLTSGSNEPEDTTRRLAEKFGLTFTKTAEGMQMHGIVTNVIDREGRWRARFHGLEFQSVNLVLFVNALVNDVHKPAAAAPEQSFWSRLLSLF